jgi:HAD domain in Swiss Army Knife RNA repair proteins
MASGSVRPLLLIDVDGVVSLFGFPGPPPSGLMPTAVDGVPHLLSGRAGERLLRLAASFECVWCTGWEERADEHLPRLLGVPRGWPHVPIEAVRGAPGRHWKLGAIESHAGPDRALAWIDDDIDASCEAWAADRPGPTLLVRTDPATGIADAHVSALEDWARRL